MIDAGHQAIEDQQSQDKGRVEKKFLPVEHPGDEQVRVTIIKGNDEQVVDKHERRKIVLRPKVGIQLAGAGIKRKRQHEKAKPGCDMDDDLNGYLLHKKSC